MRISYKVFVVGGIPITIAAAIALVAWLLLDEAERARSGAVVASSVYRQLVIGVGSRDDYVRAHPAARTAPADRLAEVTREAETALADLARLAPDPGLSEATTRARDALGRFVARFADFRVLTQRHDRLVAEMGARAASLIALTDEARLRQRRSNADIVSSLTDSDHKLRAAREVVDGLVELRAALAVAELEIARRAPDGSPHAADSARRITFALSRLKAAAADLATRLKEDNGEKAASELAELAAPWEQLGNDTSGTIDRRLVEWSERLLKLYSTEQRTLYDETSQLFAYAVQANETEQATQTIAVSVLKLGQRTTDVLARRDPTAVQGLEEESQAIASAIARLPISPLIQTEMTDAVGRWRESLATAKASLVEQNAMIGDMDRAAATMIEAARALNDMFTANADRIGIFVRTILASGAAVGLLLGGVAALFVAGSITAPLRRLQGRMVELAADPLGGRIEDDGRSDELGDMARAANFFVTEIGAREQALREAKNRADAALADLKTAQSDLIQAEKLASLGQLVAGVAHEINTPLGIALTTATQLGDEVRQIRAAAESGQMPRSLFTRFLDRMGEGSRLLFANLTRAGDLVHSFKQVAADQASGERRRFDMKVFLGELTTSLGPALRKSGHQVIIDCRPGLALDTFPGALGQVLTNMVMNAVTHAYGPGEAGKLTITVTEPATDHVRVIFADDGRGIAPENIGKVFDPFFTTGRHRGSTGLGLHIVYNLVTATLQGRVDVESTPGKGTRFVIDLPASPVEPAARRPLPAA